MGDPPGIKNRKIGLKIGFGMSKESERKRKREYARKRPEYALWYGRKRWKELRLVILAENPICARCDSHSEVVDHKNPHRGDERMFYARWNLQALCKRCHDSKTARKDSNFAKGGKDKLLGACDESGMPTDPRHPWNN